MRDDIHPLDIKVVEGRCALNVNGIPLAKRHLKSCFKGDMKQMFFRYLATVPFLYEKGDEISKSESQKYLTAKAKRIYKHFGITDDNVSAFILICMEESEDLPSGLGRELAESLGTKVLDLSDPNLEEEIAEIEDDEAREEITDIVRTLQARRNSKKTLH
jgi:hypothetical protein